MKSLLYCAAAPAEGEARTPALAGFAIDLASRLGAHLSIVSVAPKLESFIALPVPVVASLFVENDRRRADAAKAICAEIQKAAVGAGVAASGEVLHSTFPALEQALLARAQVNELAIVARPPQGDLVLPALVDALMFKSGRPLLLADASASAPATFNRIVIGWDGGMQAARAVWDSLPLLKAATSVEIVSVTQDKDLKRATPGAELAPALARHGVAVTVSELPRQGGSAAATLLSHATHTRSDLLVVGAFGHNRWREIVLGGVTQELLTASSIPVFMSR